MATLAVVIPAKDEEEYLPTLLAGLARQTRQPEETIVADARSTDRTREIATAFGARVVDGGLPGPGRNRGAAVASSDFLFFFDADVRLLGDDFLQKAIDECERRKLDVATTDVALSGGNGWDRWSHRFYNRYARSQSGRHPRAPGFCILIRRTLHERIGGFDETVTFCEDHDYVMRAGRVGAFGILDDVQIGVTTRRFERDGRLNIAIKFCLAELHLLLLGPIRHDFFRYRFG